MALSAGTRLGPYELLSAAGAGGMGEVYRARDTRLERTVAVKVLPQHFSSNAELKQRFEREARTISQLQHPHICVLHDVGSQNGTDYLVMEYLEGETLAERLRKGPLPLDQLLKIGIEIADALDKAHRSAIIHRDLKPANIMLTKSGAKLMDFGLARGFATPASAAASAQSGMPSFTATPTMTHLASPLTREGTIIGTLNYMSPEQIEGKEADARTDIFAFGAVLYEMATGKRAFEGKSHISVASAILEKEPQSVSALRPTSPSSLDALIRICLNKDPEDRFASAHDVKIQLQLISAAPAIGPTVAVRSSFRERVLAVALATAVALCIWLLYSRSQQVQPPRAPVHSRIDLSDYGGAMHYLAPGAGPYLSPDGRNLAYVGRGESTTQIWLKNLASNAVEPLNGTSGAYAAFWSADSRHLAFVADGKLKTIAIPTKAVSVIGDSGGLAVGSWNKAGVIILGTGPVGSFGPSIFRLPENGGKPVAITSPPQGSRDFTPTFLPDGSHFTFNRAKTGEGDGEVMIGSLDGSSPRSLEIRARNRVSYASGRLLYITDRGLVAQRFNTKALRLEGDPVLLVEAPALLVEAPQVSYSVSSNGLLVHRLLGDADRSLIQYARSGIEEQVAVPAGLLNNPRLSPDGNLLAYDVVKRRAGGRDVWIYDMRRHASTRLTLEGSNNSDPIWSPDGTRVLYYSLDPPERKLLLKSMDGSTPAELVYNTSSMPGGSWARSWSRDGRLLFLDGNRGPGVATEMWCLQLFGDHKLVPLHQNGFSNKSPQISPDGNWLAFVSNQTGREEVFIAAFPGPGATLQVSLKGGYMPRWRGDGRELYFITAADRIAAAEINHQGATLQVGKIQELFSVHPYYPAGNPFDVSADGKTFIVNSVAEQQSVWVNLVTNWDAELK